MGGLPYRRMLRDVGSSWPLWAALTLSMIWVPTIGRGYCGDDFRMVSITVARFLENPFWGHGSAPPVEMNGRPFHGEGRPVEMLTFALLPTHPVLQHATSLALYVASIWLMWRLCGRLGLGPWPTFLALSSFFHPAFLWSVTWVAQRNDLLVIASLLLALLSTRVPLTVALIVLGSGTKPPFFFQNLVFAFQFARRRRLFASAIALLAMLVFGIGIYLTRYAEESSVPDSLYGLQPSIAIPLRIAKLLEGIVYVLAPIPMFAVSSWMPFVALAAYGLLWAVVLRSPQWSGTTLTANLWIPAMALAMCVPFLFASEIRVTGPAAVMGFLTIAAALHDYRPQRVAVVGILLLNLAGIFLNYGTFRSTQYDIHAQIADCNYYSQPSHAFVAWREDVRRRVLTALGVRTEFRALP